MKLSEIVTQAYRDGLYVVRTSGYEMEAMDYLSTLTDDPDVSATRNEDGSISVTRLNEDGYAESTEWVRLAGD